MMTRALTPGLVLFSLIAIVAACLLGSTPLPIGRVLSAFFGAGDPGDQLVVWSIRLTREQAGIRVGGSHGNGGATKQRIKRKTIA